MYTLHTLTDQPLIDTTRHPDLGCNINGPSLIRVPDWVTDRLGLYYLYFAHHEGTYIRLAYADSLTGPWTVYPPGVLDLSQTGFCQQSPAQQDLHPDVIRMIADGIDNDSPHIASPDVHIDSQKRQLHLYFHGRLSDGTQATRFATSNDGLRFSVERELLGISYFRVFQYQQYFYAIALGARLYRSANRMNNFEQGPALTDQHYRHGAILPIGNSIYVVWTRAKDCPERLLISRLDCSESWHDWQLVDTTELHRPRADWEGAAEPLEASDYGGLMTAANQIRDPAVYQENGRTYIVYSVAAEQGLAIGELLKA